MHIPSKIDGNVDLKKCSFVLARNWNTYLSTWQKIHLTNVDKTGSIRKCQATICLFWKEVFVRYTDKATQTFKKMRLTYTRLVCSLNPAARKVNLPTRTSLPNVRNFYKTNVQMIGIFRIVSKEYFALSNSFMFHHKHYCSDNTLPGSASDTQDTHSNVISARRTASNDDTYSEGRLCSVGSREARKQVYIHTLCASLLGHTRLFGPVSESISHTLPSLVSVHTDPWRHWLKEHICPRGSHHNSM